MYLASGQVKNPSDSSNEVKLCQEQGTADEGAYRAEMLVSSMVSPTKSVINVNRSWQTDKTKA